MSLFFAAEKLKFVLTAEAVGNKTCKPDVPMSNLIHALESRTFFSVSTGTLAADKATLLADAAHLKEDQHCSPIRGLKCPRSVARLVTRPRREPHRNKAPHRKEGDGFP